VSLLVSHAHFNPELVLVLMKRNVLLMTAHPMKPNHGKICKVNVSLLAQLKPKHSKTKPPEKSVNEKSVP
jgi:hypothetical protein